MDWYTHCSENSNATYQIIDDVPKRRCKRRKGILGSCESVSLGYIDLEVSEKQEGNIRSCIQDAFINAGFLFGKDISKQLYKEVPPKRTKNTQLREILKSSVIKENFLFPPIQHFTNKKGGNEWLLLRYYVGTGVYIVYCTVESQKKVQEYHAFVYDSNFTEWEGKRYYGAIIDNRKHSYLRAFSHEDLIDINSTRKSLSSYFGGVTRVNGWFKIIGKI